MDVFIANGYDQPSFISEILTNYDYEVLLHELGHALGLKHPFAASGNNTVVLSTREDNTLNTAMSYEDNASTFTGTFRSLDWMTLTKFYGVKSSYNADNNTYTFSNTGGTFIIDGSGLDTISVANTELDAVIDLRFGMHSHLGKVSDYITDANQLTISHGSNIENVESGNGNDRVTGNSLDNIIITNAGNDTIFAGDGLDFINSGSGADQIDLSEKSEARDTILLNSPSLELGFDTIYGFFQGAFGDIFDME